LTLGQPGDFIDLFSGAGGLGLGFKWAGWTPLVANDISATYLSTYSKNVHHRIVGGSIASEEVQAQLIDLANKNRQNGKQLWVLGGPPCQGFSTAGNQRTVEDPRCQLVWDYVRFLEKLKPDGFVFENVTGLLNMGGGAVFEAVCSAFSHAMPSITSAVLSAEHYGVPQRRKRVILVGSKDESFVWTAPERLTAHGKELETSSSFSKAISVGEAISDLPPIAPGGDGRALPYATVPQSLYQQLMRGVITPMEYLSSLQAS
jgi:DNA (cytosine-5)-methyltransferase 1